MSSVFFPIFTERSFKSRQNARVDIFLRQETFRRIQNGVFPFTVAEVCSMDCLQLPFIRVDWTLQRFLTRKIWPKKRSLFMTNKSEEEKNLKMFQVNRKPNATGRRRLTTSNRAAIFVSTSCEERHNKPFWL